MGHLEAIGKPNKSAVKALSASGSSQKFFLQLALQIKELELELAEVKHAKDSETAPLERALSNRRSTALEKQLTNARKTLADHKRATMVPLSPASKQALRNADSSSDEN
jgi:hypothetical protein